MLLSVSLPDHSHQSWSESSGSHQEANDEGSERRELTASEFQYSKLRWCLLFHSVLIMGFMQYGTLFYSSIALSLKEYFGFTARSFLLFSVWQFLAYVIMFLPSVWFFNRYGVRVYLICACVGNVTAFAIRCVHGSNLAVNVAAQVSMAILSVCYTPGTFYSPRLADLYFPSTEYNFATSAAALVPQLGATLAFVLAGFVMPDPDGELTTLESVHRVFNLINYVSAGLAGIVCFGLIGYPPERKLSSADSLSLTEVLQDTKRLYRCPTFYMGVFRFCFVSVNNGLMMVWPLFLVTKEMSQQLTGTVLAVAGVAIIAGNLLFGRLADMIRPAGIKNIFIAVSVVYFAANLGLFYSECAAFSASMVFILTTTSGAAWGLMYLFSARLPIRSRRLGGIRLAHVLVHPAGDHVLRRQ